MLEDIRTIIALCVLAGLLLIVAVLFIIKFVQALKGKTAAEVQQGIEEAKNLLTQGVQAAVQFAEQLRSKTGTALDSSAKKAVALNEVKAFCAENQIEYNAETVDQMIEDTVALTKTVNAPTTQQTSDSVIKGSEIK